MYIHLEGLFSRIWIPIYRSRLGASPRIWPYDRCICYFKCVPSTRQRQVRRGILPRVPTHGYITITWYHDDPLIEVIAWILTLNNTLACLPLQRRMLLLKGRTSTASSIFFLSHTFHLTRSPQPPAIIHSLTALTSTTNHVSTLHSGKATYLCRNAFRRFKHPS